MKTWSWPWYIFHPYLTYVFRHKWFVFVECCKLLVPWRGIVHDMNKFHPAEVFAYAAYFYGGYRPFHEIPYGARQYETPLEEVQGRFNRAWLRHQHKAPHHWQHWVLRNDNGNTEALIMPDGCMKEMLADWRGAGRALGKPDTAVWYLRNQKNIILHPYTRRWIEEQLHVGEVTFVRMGA